MVKSRAQAPRRSRVKSRLKSTSASHEDRGLGRMTLRPLKLPSLGPRDTSLQQHQRLEGQRQALGEERSALLALEQRLETITDEPRWNVNVCYRLLCSFVRDLSETDMICRRCLWDLWPGCPASLSTLTPSKFGFLVTMWSSIQRVKLKRSPHAGAKASFLKRAVFDSRAKMLPDSSGRTHSQD